MLSVQANIKVRVDRPVFSAVRAKLTAAQQAADCTRGEMVAAVFTHGS